MKRERPSQSGGRVMDRGAHPPKNAAKTISDGDDVFETQERTIGVADRARKAPKQAKKEHAWHDFVYLENKWLCFRSYSSLLARKFLKLKLRMTRTNSDTAASYCRPVVNHHRQRVGVSVLTNQLRQSRPRGGPCCAPWTSDSW